MAFARKTVTNYVFTRGTNTTAIGGSRAQEAAQEAAVAQEEARVMDAQK
jgi:hypothetical protein